MNDFIFLSDLYEEIYYWMAGITPGEYAHSSYFKYMDKKIWSRIKEKFIELENKKYLTPIEKEFLDCHYVGKAYRIINYYSKRKGQVYPINRYQSCSKTIRGLKRVNLKGDVTFIKLFASKKSYSIDLIKLLEFMIKYELIIYKDNFTINNYNIMNLGNYIDEEEVLVVLSTNNIKDISIRNFDKKLKMPLEEPEWYRKTLN